MPCCPAGPVGPSTACPARRRVPRPGRSGRPLAWLVLALALAGPGGAAPAAAQARYRFEDTPTRLSKDLRPRKVELTLDVDPASPTFRGEARLHLQARRAQRQVQVHARRLKPEQALLFTPGRAPRTLDVAIDDSTQTWRLTPRDGRPVPPGPLRVHLRYQGEVNPSGEGLFVVPHRVQGETVNMLATQLESNEARTVLPLLDEPVFRTVFALQVRAPSGLQVLSNMPRVAMTQETGGTTLHRFAPTPAMPGYLLALSVGRFDVLEDRVDGLPLRIFTAPGKRELARFAMASTRQLLPYYRNYFGQPFALPKLDQLAVPGVRIGAMEDWGLISYQESALLFDPARSSPRTQQRIFGFLAHEIAHQWFGNLVSLASWDEAWLNEAFATWMDRKASRHFHPEWQTVLQQRNHLEDTFERDAGESTRAIRSGPVEEDSVFEVFDDITYDKGGAVLTMLEQWLGEAAFQRALAAYMAERRMKPATAGDLWHHFQRATGRPVAAVAGTWTDQPGLPLVQVHAQCENGRTVVQLSQQRFWLGEGAAPAAKPWPIPVRLQRAGSATAPTVVLLDRPRQRLSLPGCADAPLLANAGGLGYYRVQHDELTQAELVRRLPLLDPADQLTLLADSFALLQAGHRPASDHLRLLAALPSVRPAQRPALYEQALRQWELLRQALAGTPAQAALQRAGIALLAPELERLGWQPAADEDVGTQRLRAGLVRALAKLDHAATLERVRELFARAWPADQPQALHPSLRSAVLEAAGRRLNDAQFNALLQAFHATEREEERRQLIEALCQTEDPRQAQRLLDDMAAGKMPPNHVNDLPRRLSDNMTHATAVYGFVLQHWPALASQTGGGPFGGRQWLLPGAAAGSLDPAMPERLLADQARIAGSAGESAARRAAAQLRLRLALRQAQAEPMAQALARWSPEPAAH